MPDFNDWPELSWQLPSTPARFLADRISEMAGKARAFELALEESAAAGEAPLSSVAELLEEWEAESANVYMYAGVASADRLAGEDPASHAEELEKIWLQLRRLRREVLEKLGAAAAKVASREAAARPTRSDLNDRIGELPSFTGSADPLSGEATAAPSFAPRAAPPVSPEELRMRQAAEQKLMPEGRGLGALLALQPSEWVMTIAETLELDQSENPDLTMGTRSNLLRGLIARRLADEQALSQLVFGLEEADRELLLALLEANGALPHAAVRKRFGTDDADGFFWSSRPPSGPLSRLRRVGLVFVASLKGQPHAVLPSDVAPRVGAMLESAAKAGSES